jgi:DNA repair exonuclease SbcCD ATPase subunit
MLRQVTARNWRAFDIVDVELQPGLNVLLGPNGVGKTSLLEAAAFALAGAPSTLPDAKQMVRADGQPVDVAVVLELDGTRWQVSRGLGPAGRRGAEILRRGGQTTADGADDVSAALETLLGVPSDFYLRILYMPEGDVYRFLDRPPMAALDAHLRRVLGLEQLVLIDQAASRVKREVEYERANLTTLADRVAERSQVLAEGRRRWSDPAAHQRVLEEKRERLVRAQAEAGQESRAAADAAHTVARRLSELVTVDGELAALASAGDAAAEYAAARAECARRQTAIARLDADLATATAQQKVSSEQRRALAARAPAELATDEPALRALLDETATARERLDAALASARAESQAAAERARALRARAPADLLADDPALRARRDAREATLRRIDDALVAAATARQTLQESTQFLGAHAPGAEVESTCPVCRQPLPEELRQRLLAENAARDAEIVDRVAALQAERAAEVAAGEAEAEALKQRLLDETASRAASAADREAAAQAEREAQTAAVHAAAEAARGRRLAAHDADARALAERITALRTERQSEQAALETAEAREGAAVKARQRLDALTARRQALLPGDATAETLQAEQERLAAAETAARERETALGNEVDGVRQEAAQLRGYLDIAAMEGYSPEALAAARASLARRELLAELFATATKDALSQLRDSALSGAYDEVAAAWEQFIGWAGVRVAPEAKGKRLTVRRDGRNLDLAQLSGGERAAFLALLHAHLGRHFGRGGFLLLDEPLEHLDAANGRKLLEHLVRACADGTLTQVVIATVESAVVREAIRDGEAHIITLPLANGGRA